MERFLILNVICRMKRKSVLIGHVLRRTITALMTVEDGEEAMNSSLTASKIPSRLAEEFYTVFGHQAEARKFKFIRKYFRFLEEENSCIKHLFSIDNPIIERLEDMREVPGLEKTCLTFLRKVLKDRKSRKSEPLYSQALVFLGISYELGALHLKKCVHTAFKYYNSAAKLRDPLGTFRLGQCHEKGIGAEARVEKALTFYRVAAKLGSVEALHTFGAILLYGECGIEKDLSTGMFYIQLAVKQADNSYPYPFFDLAKCYDPDNPGCITRDADYAFEIYQSGAHIGCPNCQHRIARAYEYAELNIGMNMDESISWYQKASRNGHVDAQLMMSTFYFRGVSNVLGADSVQAYFWALKAACKGHPNAAFTVGEFIETGIGINTDEAHALWWYSIAASLGHAQANVKIADLRHHVKGYDQASYGKRWWNWLF